MVLGKSNVPMWPIALRTKRDFYWLYDEKKTLMRTYRKWVPILDMVTDDFTFVEKFQNQVFARLTRDVNKFEKAHYLEIH